MESEKAKIEALARDHGLMNAVKPQRENSMACVSFPTCPLAMAEAERFLPSFTDKVEAILEKHSIRTSILLCALPAVRQLWRAMLAELGLVGKAPGRYNLHLAVTVSARVFRVCSARISLGQKFSDSINSLSGAGRKARSGEGFKATLRCVRALFARCPIRKGFLGGNHER